LVIFVSNLFLGLEAGLDEPSRLVECVSPFKTNVGIEIFLHCHDRAYMDKAQKIKDWIGNCPRTTHGPFINIELTSTKGTEEYDRFISGYHWALETANSFYAKEMVVHTNQRIVRNEEKTYLQHICIDNLRMLSNLAARYQVTLLIENLGVQKEGIPLFNQEEFTGLIESIPYVECLIDIGHLNVAKWDIERLLAKLGKRIVAYHLHNNDGQSDSHLRINEGTFNIIRFFDLYHLYTNHSNLTLEYDDHLALHPQQVIDDIIYIKKRFLMEA